MEIINLDKFVTDFGITLNGKKYIVSKMRVKDVFNKENLLNLEDNINFIVNHSNIPRNVLEETAVEKISYITNAIMGICRNQLDLDKYIKALGEETEEELAAKKKLE